MSDEASASQPDAAATPAEIGAAAVDKAFEDIQSLPPDAAVEIVESKDRNDTVEIHKPKPVHSWRELLTEIGVIVIGVAIALAGEQAVEFIHWRTQVGEAREAIAAEMAQNIGTAIVAWRSQFCAERRLDEVAQILDKAAESGVLPPVGDIGRPTPRLWRTATWDSMVASQTVTHFPTQQLAELAGIYTMVRLEIETVDNDAWTDLDAISGPGRPLDPASLADLRRALSHARDNARKKASLASLILERVDAQHLPYSPQDLDLIAVLRREAQNSDKGVVSAAAAKILRGGFRICWPIGAAPAHYGQAPPATAPLLTDERLKALPDFGDGAKIPPP